MLRITDSTLLRLAANQHGIVARWQLTAAGMSARSIEGRIRLGALKRLHRCVYQVGSLTGVRAKEMALVFSFGPYAAASHQTAAGLYGLLPDTQARPCVSVWRGNPDIRQGVDLCRARIAPDELAICDGVPATSADRTLLDLAARLSDRLLEQALATAIRAALVTEASLHTLMGRYPHRHGAPRLASVLDSSREPVFTRSEAEERLLDLVRRARLPAPAVNVRISGFEVDFYWRGERLIVEVDGLEFHSSRTALQADRRRDAKLVAAGLRVLRFTWSDVTAHPEATVAILAAALARVS